MNEISPVIKSSIKHGSSLHCSHTSHSRSGDLNQPSADNVGFSPLGMDRSWERADIARQSGNWKIDSSRAFRAQLEVSGFAPLTCRRMSQADRKSAAANGPITKPLIPKVAMPPRVDSSTT